MHFRPLAGIIGLGLLASSHAQNKVPFYFPGYGTIAIGDLTGSILGSSGATTTFSVNCPPALANCAAFNASGQTVTENPSSFIVTTSDSNGAMHMNCTLSGSPTATCIIAETAGVTTETIAGQTFPPVTNSFTSTYSGTDLAYGSLTLVGSAPITSPPTTATGTASGKSASGTASSTPSSASKNVAQRTGVAWALVAGAGAAGVAAVGL